MHPTSTNERLQHLETLVGEVHAAVVGNGAPGSSLREQIIANGRDISHLQSAHRWGLAKGLLWPVITAAAAYLGVKGPISL